MMENRIAINKPVVGVSMCQDEYGDPVVIAVCADGTMYSSTRYHNSTTWSSWAWENGPIDHCGGADDTDHTGEIR